MADRLIGTLCMAVVAVAACGCGPDEAAAQSPARKVVAGIAGATLPIPLAAQKRPEPPQTPELLEPLPQPAVITVVFNEPPVTAPAGPGPAPAPSGAEPGITDLSRRIEDVMGALDQLVEESLRVQQSLLRLRFGAKRPEPDAAPAGSP